MLLLHGVPEEKGEDAIMTVTNVVANKLRIAEFRSDSVSRAHRLGRSVENRPRPLLVKFKDVSVRDKVWFTKSKLKGTGITQAEFLTKNRHSVFLKARQRFGVNKCWTRDGVIHVLAPDGTHHQVEVQSELDAICSTAVTVAPTQPLANTSKPVPNKDTRVKRAVSKKV